MTGAHSYADEGSLALAVAVTAPDPVSSVTATAGASATVSELDNLTAGSPVTFSPTQGASFSGPVATFTDSAYPTNVASDFTATIVWGDGTTTTGTITNAGGTFTVSGTHTYTGSGTFGVTVTLADGAPGTDSAVAHSTATVSASSPITPPTNIPASPLQSGAGVCDHPAVQFQPVCAGLHRYLGAGVFADRGAARSTGWVADVHHVPQVPLQLGAS